MATFLTYVLDAAAALLAIPVTMFIVEIIAALAPASPSVVPRPASRGRIAVLVPAHDEIRPQKLRRGVQLGRRRLPEPGLVKVKRPRGVALRRYDAMKF